MKERPRELLLVSFALVLYGTNQRICIRQVKVFFCNFFFGFFFQPHSILDIMCMTFELLLIYVQVGQYFVFFLLPMYL